MPGINASTMTKPPSTILKDVVAFVDVWSTSKRENFSDGFITQLTEMGAKVSKTLNKHVTHVIFKHGHQSTWKKAEKMGLKLVSVLWVNRCKNEGQHIEESLCPALNEESKSVLVNKRTHKCMQPRDAPARTPENDKRLKKKLEKMMEKMVPSSPVVPTWSPLIIDEENGIIYSPSLRRAEAMAERLREMREQRENLSPTASQMVESMRHDASLKPAIGSSPPSSSSFMQMLEQESDEESSASHLGLSTPDATAQLSGTEGSQQQLLCLSASRSDYSSLGLSTSSIAPSQEKKTPRTHTHKLLASTPLSGDMPTGRAAAAAAASSSTSSGSKAASSSNRKGRSKTPAKRRSTKQNSLDSYFSSALPKGKQEHTVMVNDTFDSDGETSSRKSPVHEGELKLTPPDNDWSVVEETPLRGSPTFTETRTKTNNLSSETWTEMMGGGNAEQTSTSPVLPVIRNGVKDRTLSYPEAARQQPTKAASVVSELKKISKCSSRRSPAKKGGNDDGAFEDYFSSTEKPSSRRKTFCLDFLPENDPFSPFEQAAKPSKRKRRKSESEETTSKRHRHTPVNAADFLADTTSGLDGPSDKDEPCSSSKLKRTPRRKSVSKQQQQQQQQKQSASGGKGRRRLNAATADDDGGGGVDDDDGGDEERVVEQERGDLPSPPKAPTPADVKRERLALTVFASPMTSRVKSVTRGRKGTQTLGRGSKNAPDGLRDSSTEMFSCQIGAKDKNVKSKRTLVMTSMPTEKQQTVLQVVKSLGGFSVVDTVCESTTHVVAGSPRRTLNILLGIARGCWVVSYEWILWCLEHRQWIPEEPYELSDHFPAAPICRLQQHLSAGEHQQDLFQGLPPMFVSPLVQPPQPSLQELIGLCGGAVCHSVRQAGICIGEYRGRKPEGARSLSEQWILDCVTHLKRLPFEDYNLEYQCP